MRARGGSARDRADRQGRRAAVAESFEPAPLRRRAGPGLRADGHDHVGRAGAELLTNLYSLPWLVASQPVAKAFAQATAHELPAREESVMSDRPSKIALAVLLAFGTIGVSTQQRTAPATDATSRAVAAAEAFLATLDQSQRSQSQHRPERKDPHGVVEPARRHRRCRWVRPSGTASGSAMTPAQEKAALALVATALSREGYQKAMEIVDADEVLETRSAPTRKPGAQSASGARVYYVAILGKPSTTDTVDAAVRRTSPRHQRDVCRARERAHADAHRRAAGDLHAGRPDDPSAGRRERQSVRADQRAQCRTAETGDSRR